ncbi:ankyrin repeat-containing domain protein, partial [Diaporthe sp. PMI_573]
ESGTFYLACLQGGDILQAHVASSDVDLNGPLPGELGDNMFHRILRIPAEQFHDCKGEVIKLLLRNGADPLARDRLGENILHILAGSTEQEPHDLLSFLLDGDTNDLTDVRTACKECINEQNDFGDTPLIVAALYNQRFSVELLLRSGADMEMRGEFDMTALDFATSRNYGNVIDVL